MPIQDNDLFLIDDGGTPKKVTAANLLANCEGSYADKFLLINDNSDNSYKMKASNLKTKLAESTTRWMMVERGGVSYKAQNTTLAEYFASASYWHVIMRANQRNETTEVNSISVDDGYVYSFGRSRAFSSAHSYSRPIIIKKDMEGQTIWKKYFDTGNDWYAGFYAGKVKNGYIYAAGECPSSIGNSDPWLVKLDTDGNVEWQMNYGHSGQTTANRWYGVDVDNSGNVYTTGRYKEYNSGGGIDRTQAILAKWNSSGTLQWQRRLTSPAWTNNPNGINYYTNGYAVAVDTYGNPYMVGDGFATSSTNNFLSGFIVKFNSSGTYQWGKYYDNSDNDGYQGITIDSFNRIFVCGRWNTGSGGSGVVAYYSTNGYLNWRRNFTANISGNNRGLNVLGITSDNSGNAYVAGQVNLETTHGNRYSIFAKIDSSGNLVWKGELTNSKWEHGYIAPERGGTTVQMGDGGFIVGATGSIADGGTATRDMVLLHLPSDAPLIGTYGNFTGINESTIQWNTNVPGTHSSLSSSSFNTPPFTTASSSFNIYNISSGIWDDTVTTIEV